MTTTTEQDLELTAPSGATASAPSSPLRRNALVAGAVLVAAVGTGTWYRSAAFHETTDDAQIDGEVVAVPARTGGTIAHIRFVENQTVHAGDVLAEIDDDQAKARLAQAEASLASAGAAANAADADARVAESNARGNAAASVATLRASAAQVRGAKDQIAEAGATLGSAEATLRQALTDRDRTDRLFREGAVAQTALDQADTMLTVARANADAARARLVTLQSGVDQATSRVEEASARAKQQSDVASLVEQARARALQAHAQVADGAGGPRSLRRSTFRTRGSSRHTMASSRRKPSRRGSPSPRDRPSCSWSRPACGSPPTSRRPSWRA